MGSMFGDCGSAEYPPRSDKSNLTACIVVLFLTVYLTCDVRLCCSGSARMEAVPV